MRKLPAVTCGIIMVAVASLLPFAAQDVPVCPACGMPVEPGAAFCTQCGHKLESAVPPADPANTAPDPGASVVQVVAAHDKEMTSTYGAIAYGSTLRVDSMLGTAFAIAPSEFVTDSGLLTGVQEVSLYTAAQRKIPARVVGVDHRIGVALLAADALDIPPVATRSGEPAKLGERLRVLGFPSTTGTGSGLLVTSGVLSGLHRTEFGIHPIEDYQQSDATLPDGFAGAPVIDAEGRLVGMSTALPLGRRLLLGPVGIGVSIPLVWIERALDWIRAGQPPRPWLGILAMRSDPDRLAEYRLPAEVRSIVEQVFPDSPAARAGIRRGDGLMRAGTIDGSDLIGVHERLVTGSPGDDWEVEILRDGERRSLTLTLSARPDRPRLAALDALRFYGGIEMSPRGRRLAVTRVLPHSVAANRKIEAGDVLQSVLMKKDLQNAGQGVARWRSVRNVEKLEELLRYAYSELDFFVGLRFKPAKGSKRELYLHEILLSTGAL